MLADELVGGTEDSASIERHTRLEGQVVAQHRAHADRIAVVVGYSEIEDRPAHRRGIDRVTKGGDLMADGLDHDIRPIAGLQTAHPPVAGGAHDRVDPELLADRSRSTGSTPVTWRAPNAFAA